MRMYLALFVVQVSIAWNFLAFGNLYAGIVKFRACKSESGESARPRFAIPQANGQKVYNIVTPESRVYLSATFGGSLLIPQAETRSLNPKGARIARRGWEICSANRRAMRHGFLLFFYKSIYARGAGRGALRNAVYAGFTSNLAASVPNIVDVMQFAVMSDIRGNVKDIVRCVCSFKAQFVMFAVRSLERIGLISSAGRFMLREGERFRWTQDGHSTIRTFLKRSGLELWTFVWISRECFIK